MNIGNLTSGLAGALAGIVASYIIYWLSCKRIAKESLLLKLVVLLSCEFTATEEGNGEKNIEAWKGAYTEIYGLYLIYRRYVFLGGYDRLEKEWEKYQGNDKTDVGTDLYVTPSFFEAQKRVRDFINYLKK